MRIFLNERGHDTQVRDRVLFELCAKYFGITLPPSKWEARTALSKHFLEDVSDVPKPTKKKKAPPALAIPFYDTDEWRTVRYMALKQHGGCCQCCGNRAAPGRPLHVDHIKPRSKFPELELELNNLQVLCADCNLGKRAWDETDWRAA